LQLIKLSALLGILQNRPSAPIIRQPPFLDFIQGSKAAEAGIVIAQAAISYAR
jgi:hypothetical protein